MINFIGLQGPGVVKFRDEKLPLMLRFGVPVIVNVCGKTVAEYVGVVECLEEDTSGVITAYEVNISCPNIDHGGCAFGQDVVLAAEVVRAVRQITRRPLIVKLTPNVTNAVLIARAVIEAGANAISACNTFVARRKIWNGPYRGRYVQGGLSGPCIMPIALRIVSDLAKANLGVPIIGIGGIATVFDVVEFLESGAIAVQIGTASLTDPLVMMKLIQNLGLYIEMAGCQSLAEWRAKGLPMPKDEDLRKLRE